MSSLEGCRGRHFQTKLKLLVKYYVIYIISSTASAVQSGGYERPKCNGSYLEITMVMRWWTSNMHSEPGGKQNKTRKDVFIVYKKVKCCI